MSTNLLIVLRTMSKVGIYALIILQSMTLALAGDVNSQGKLLKDLSIQLTEERIELLQLFRSIEEKTGISFAYKIREIRGTEISITPREWNLEDLLREISIQKKLSFRRINKTITVNKSATESSLPVVFDDYTEKIQVKGRVVDENNEPLPGATVLEKGTSNGTITDMEGNYMISVDEDAVLVVRFLGYATVEQAVAGRNVIDFNLEADLQSLSEIVVVGYATQLKENVTGAITEIKSDFLENRPLTDVQSGLIAAAPGVRINQNTGRPGSSPSISIRGRTTFGSDGGVLVIVDGVESALGFVDPNVIESITVLKDASASAIYGSRAANGVILITTKSGERGGRMRVNYTFNTGWQTPTMVPELVNAEDYMIMRNKGAVNDGNAEEFTPEEIELARNGGTFDTDWADVLYNNPARQTTHSLNITGASDRSDYLFSLGYLTQEGINIAADDYQRYNLRLKLNNDATDWLRVGTNVSLTYRDQQSVPIEGDREYRAVPLYPVQLEDGRFVLGDGGTSPNPALASSRGAFDTDERISIEAQLFARFQILDGLSFEQKFSVRTVDESSSTWRQDIDYVNLNFVDGALVDTVAIQALPEGNRYTLGDSRNTRFIHQSILKYDKSFSNHNFNLLAGFQSDEQINTGFSAGRQTYLLTALQDLDLGTLPDDGIGSLGLGNTSSRSAWTLASVFGRISYNYNSKYLIEGSFRYDGSSRFASDNRWGFFPSASVGWNLGRESFFVDNVSFVDVFKLRASWGQLGDAFTSGIGNYGTFQTVNQNDGYVWPNGSEAGFVPGTIANPNLVWETATVRNIGLDAVFFGDKLNLEVEYFVNDREDILDGSPAVPDEFGFNVPTLNGAKMRSEGWEFNISHSNTVGDIRYTVGVNYSNANNEVLQLGESGPRVGGNVIDVGQPFNAIRGFRTDGFFRDQFDIDDYNEAYEVTSELFPPSIGRPRIVDANDDGIIDNEDRVILDDNTNNHFVGGRLSVTYKNLTLSAIINGILQRKVYWNGAQVDLHFSGGVGSPFAAHKSSYDPDRPFETSNAEFPRITSGLANYNRSDLWLKDAAYVRLRNVTLAYDAAPLARKILSDIASLKIYASIENPLILWTNFFAEETGWDPELGVGSVSYPLPRTIAFGLNLNF